MVRISLSNFFCIVLLCFTSLSCIAYSRAEYDRTLPTPMTGPKEFRFIRHDNKKEVLLFRMDKDNKPTLSALDGKDLTNLTLSAAESRWGKAYKSEQVTKPSFYFLFDTLESRLVRFWVEPDKKGNLIGYYLRVEDNGSIGDNFERQ